MTMQINPKDVITLDIDSISDELYFMLLEAFREQAEYEGKDPETLWFNCWTVTSTFESTVAEETV